MLVYFLLSQSLFRKGKRTLDFLSPVWNICCLLSPRAWMKAGCDAGYISQHSTMPDLSVFLLCPSDLSTWRIFCCCCCFVLKAGWSGFTFIFLNLLLMPLISFLLCILFDIPSSKAENIEHTSCLSDQGKVKEKQEILRIKKIKIKHNK